MFGIHSVYMLLIIPILCTITILCLWPKSVKWWEILILFGGSTLAIFIGQLATEKIAVTDTEYWGYNPHIAMYDEPFRYWGECSREVPDGES